MRDQRSSRVLPLRPLAESLSGSRPPLGARQPHAAAGLLVSVRSVAEAMVALGAGVDLLDVKEPSRGALGRADWHVIADVARCAAARERGAGRAARRGRLQWLARRSCLRQTRSGGLRLLERLAAALGSSHGPIAR